MWYCSQSDHNFEQIQFLGSVAIFYWLDDLNKRRSRWEQASAASHTERNGELGKLSERGNKPAEGEPKKSSNRRAKYNSEKIIRNRTRGSMTQFCIIGDLKKSLQNLGWSEDFINELNPSIADYFHRSNKECPAGLLSLPRQYMNYAAGKTFDERIEALK